MKFSTFFSQIQLFWRSSLMKGIRSRFRRFSSLHWWVGKSWKFKVQLLISLTAFLLLLVSLEAWSFYRTEYSKFSNNFIRLQLFGPQEIFYSTNPTSSEPTNFCQFHIETRQPYGHALSNARIEVTFKTMNGTPFWYHSDQTGPDGTFQLPVPNMPMPERVQMTIHAEDGPKKANFTAFLRTSPRPQNVCFTLPESQKEQDSQNPQDPPNSQNLQDSQNPQDASVSQYPLVSQDSRNLQDARISQEKENAPSAEDSQASPEEPPAFEPTFQDLPLDAVATGAFQYQREKSTHSGASQLVSMTIFERVFQKPMLSISIFGDARLKGTLHPVFVGVWQENVLLASRPLAAGRATRQFSIPLPESVSGPISVLLIDCGGKSPRVLQHELVYRLPAADPEKAAEQTAFLTTFAAQLNTPEFREKAQRLDFLPSDLANPEENGSKAQKMQEKRLQLSAADRLLGSALVPIIPADHRFTIPELQPLKELCAHLDQLMVAECASEEPLGSEETVESEKQELSDGTVDLAPSLEHQSTESFISLLDLALKVQTIYLNQNQNSTAARLAYLQKFPILYDSLTEFGNTRSADFNKFHTETKVQIRSLICIILCMAMCLVLIMLMMSIQGLPTNWKTWVLTLVVVLLAFGLACLIASQSNVDQREGNLRYVIFCGEAPEP